MIRVKNITDTVKQIYTHDRRVIWWIALLVVMGLAIIITTVWNLEIGVADGMIVRYSDGGGYEKGGWGYMLEFAVMGLILGVAHPLVAIRIYEKRGRATTIMFVVASIVLALAVNLTLMRLVGEA